MAAEEAERGGGVMEDASALKGDELVWAMRATTRRSRSR